MLERAQVEQETRGSEQCTDQLPEKGNGDEPVGDRGRRAGGDREDQGGEAQEEQHDGQAVRACFEQARQRDVGGLSRGAGPGADAGGKCEQDRAGGCQDQTAGEKPAPVHREPEDGVQSLLGLVTAQSCDLGAGEQADREHEEKK